MITISADKLDYADEYDPMHEVYYEGQPFTGVAQAGLETTEYVDGRAHGRYRLYFQNGRLSAEGRYANGECTKLKSWYETGTLRETFQTEPLRTERWDRDGVRVFAGAEDEAGTYQTRWFYKNGVVKQHYVANRGTDYFASDGRLAMQVTYGHPMNSVRYVADVLRNSYLDLLTQYHYEREAGAGTASVEWYFWGWWWQLLKKDTPSAMAILHHLESLGFLTATQIRKKLPAIDLTRFEPAMSYTIVGGS